MEAKVTLLEQQVGDLLARLQAAEAATAAATAANTGGKGSSHGIDTRTLGKPEQYSGDEAKWADWRIVTKAYAGLITATMPALLEQAESTDDERNVINAVLGQEKEVSSMQLYYVLLMLCRNEPLNLIVNAGEGEGACAWYRLHKRYETSAKSHVAASLQQLLSWDFKGDVSQRLELFNRMVARYRQRSGDDLSDTIKIGILLMRMEDGPLKQHMLLNAERLKDWASVQD